SITGNFPKEIFRNSKKLCETWTSCTHSTSREFRRGCEFFSAMDAANVMNLDQVREKWPVENFFQTSRRIRPFATRLGAESSESVPKAIRAHSSPRDHREDEEHARRGRVCPIPVPAAPRAHLARRCVTGRACA